MSDEKLQSPLARRSFLSRIGAGATALGAFFGGSVAGAQSSAPAGAWQPARHAEDDWFDQPAAKHRFFLDTTNVTALGYAVFWTNNYLNVSKGTVYGLSDNDLSVVICVRHES